MEPIEVMIDPIGLLEKAIKERDDWDWNREDLRRVKACMYQIEGALKKVRECCSRETI